MSHKIPEKELLVCVINGCEILLCHLIDNNIVSIHEIMNAIQCFKGDNILFLKNIKETIVLLFKKYRDYILSDVILLKKFFIFYSTEFFPYYGVINKAILNDFHDLINNGANIQWLNNISEDNYQIFFFLPDNLFFEALQSSSISFNKLEETYLYVMINYDNDDIHSLLLRDDIYHEITARNNGRKYLYALYLFQDYFSLFCKIYKSNFKSNLYNIYIERFFALIEVISYTYEKEHHVDDNSKNTNLTSIDHLYIIIDHILPYKYNSFSSYFPNYIVSDEIQKIIDNEMISLKITSYDNYYSLTKEYLKTQGFYI